MKIIVAGCGRLGLQLAHLLDSDGNDVTVIDKDRNVMNKFKPFFKGKFIEGISFDRNTLISAGVETADALASTTDSDNINIVTALIAKKRFKVPIIIARVYDPISAEIYKKLGINTTSPTLWGANSMKDFICHPELFRVSTFGNGEVEIIETEASALVEGHSVRSFTIPSEMKVVSIVRKGTAMIPTPDTSFLKGDKIFIAVTPFGKTKMKQMMII
ncbi:MAG: TrkA family potassium uptake protein [Clostridiaceae bacterium]